MGGERRAAACAAWPDPHAISPRCARARATASPRWRPPAGCARSGPGATLRRSRRPATGGRAAAAVRRGERSWAIRAGCGPRAKRRAVRRLPGLARSPPDGGDERARRLRVPGPDREGPAATPPHGDARPRPAARLDGGEDPLAPRAHLRRPGPRQDDAPGRLEPPHPRPRPLVSPRRDGPRLGRVRPPRRGRRPGDRPGVRPEHGVPPARARRGDGRPGVDRAHAPGRDPRAGWRAARRSSSTTTS